MQRHGQERGWYMLHGLYGQWAIPIKVWENPESLPRRKATPNDSWPVRLIDVALLFLGYTRRNGQAPSQGCRLTVSWT